MWPADMAGMTKNRIGIMAVAFACLTLQGCLLGGGKDLFSAWSATDGSFILDLTNADFGSQAIGFALTGGGICACDLTIAGKQSEGTMVLSSCTFNANGTSATDPGCSSFDGPSTFKKDGDKLTICDSPTECVEFK